MGVAQERKQLLEADRKYDFFFWIIWQHFLINFTKIKIIVSLPNEQRDHLDYEPKINFVLSRNK